MNKWLALAMSPHEDSYPCDSVTKPDKTQPEVEKTSFVTFCHVSHRPRLRKRTLPLDHSTPDQDAFEERAAIAEFDGGLTREAAEIFAAQCQGYDNVVDFRKAQQLSKQGNRNE